MEVASPTVNQAIEAFLAEQRGELTPEQHGDLEMVVTLIPDALDGYAYELLSPEEEELWRERWEADEEAGSFSNTFGPEKIVGYLEPFLDWYLIRKVLGPPEIVEAASWAVGRLVDWLEAEGHATPAEAEEARARAEAAATDLPRADRLGEVLHHATREMVDEPLIEHQDWMGEMAVIAKVEPRAMWFRIEGDRREVGPVPLPRAATDLAEVGWKVSALHLARTERRWHILEVGNVYPR